MTWPTELSWDCMRGASDVTVTVSVVAPAFNEMLLRHARIGATPIEPARYQPLKTEQQLAAFEQMQLMGRAA